MKSYIFLCCMLVITLYPAQSPSVLAQQMLDLSERKGALLAQIEPLKSLNTPEATTQISNKQAELDQVSRQLDEVQNTWTKQLASTP